MNRDYTKIFDELHYLIDVSKDIQDAALKMFREKYPVP